MNLRIASALLPAFLAACSGTGGDDRSGTTPNSNPTPDPTDSALRVIGAEGGRVGIDGISVTIPAGALTATVTITVDRISAPEGRNASAPWFELGPAGLVFEAPVSIAIDVPDAVLGGEGTPRVVKHLAHPDQGNGADVVALMVLDTDWDADAHVATARTFGFSQVAVLELPCDPSPDAPQILDATWDPCTRTTHVEWRSDRPVYIEYGYRQAYGTPVTWPWGWRAPATGAFDFPALVGYPGPNQSAYTFVFKMHAYYTCQGTEYVSGDVPFQVSAFEILPPDPPTDVVAERIANDSVAVRWRPPAAVESQEDGYELVRSPTFSSMPTQDVSGVSYDDRDVDPTSDYFYSVRAYHTACGQRRVSPWASASTSQTPAPPDDVRGFTATAQSSTAVRLDWTAPRRAAEYVLARTGGRAFTDVIISAPDTSYVDLLVEPGTAYTYTLTARNLDGSSAPATAMVTTPVIASGTAECGDLRLTVMPTSQTTQVQYSCNPGDAGCPDDAPFDILVERLNGSTADVTLTVVTGDPSSWPVLEFLLGTFGGRGGDPYPQMLTDGQPSVSMIYSIRTPDYAFASTPAPLTWSLIVGARVSGGPSCEVPIMLEVEP